MYKLTPGSNLLGTPERYEMGVRHSTFADGTQSTYQAPSNTGTVELDLVPGEIKVVSMP